MLSYLLAHRHGNTQLAAGGGIRIFRSSICCSSNHIAQCILNCEVSRRERRQQQKQVPTKPSTAERKQQRQAQQDAAQQDDHNLMRHRTLIRAILPGSGIHAYVVASRRQASAASCDGDARDGAGSLTCAQQAESLCTKLASQLECELDPHLLACLLAPLAY